MGVKVSEIAKRASKERTCVNHSMRLLRLHPKVRGGSQAAEHS